MVSGAVIGRAFWPQRVWSKLGRNVKLRRFTSSPYTVPAFIFVSYLLLNTGINGPAYLSDEVGYLDKAATITGSTVHFSTSWFGGYSFMISPAFMLSSDPYIEWQLILVLNALMWAGSAFLLQYVLRNTHPRASVIAIRLATFGAMLYPSWLSMSGYAFSTSGFVLVFMGALAAIIKSDFKHSVWLGLAGLLAGYLCWIHPFGFIFLGLFLALFAFQGIAKKRWDFLPIGLISLTFVASYLLLVEPWFTNTMAGSILNDSHYSSGVSNILKVVTTLDYWVRVGEIMIGLLFFVVVATFGLAVYGALPAIKELRSQTKSWKSALQNTRLTVILLVILSVVAVVCVTALSWASSEQIRIDQWVYGRYTDMYLLPLIAFGLLANWRTKQALITAGFVVIAGIIINLVATPANTLFVFNNKVNIQALWPMHVGSVFHANYYWLWGLLGAAGVASIAWMGTDRRKRWLVILLVPIALAGAGNYIYHRTIISQHSTVSSLYTYIKSHYGSNDCIGFTPASDPSERFYLYSYYLHGYDIKKMTLDQWQQEKCSGPYMTYGYSAELAADYVIAEQEKTTGLYIISPAKNPLNLQ